MTALQPAVVAATHPHHPLHSFDAQSEHIRRACAERGVREVVHFTRAANLLSIFDEGLLSRHALKLHSIGRPQFNDKRRADGHRDAICVSIGFPNYPMFYRYRRTCPDDWVMLTMAPSALWELDCAFFEENAASGVSLQRPLAERKTAAALRAMFAERLDMSRAALGLPASYPTHPQAEVLVFEPIPLRFIRQVHFNGVAALNRWRTLDVACWFARNEGKAMPDIRIDDRFFRPRCDSGYWRKRS